MFKKMIKKMTSKKKETIYAPVKGKVISIKEVKDPTFSQELLGTGIAIIPQDETFCSPVTGIIETVFDTLHAITIKSETGIELLVHIGLDTVELKGQGFEALVKSGDHVQAGDAMMKVDISKIRSMGYDITTPIIVCNSEKYQNIQGCQATEVSVGDAILTLLK